ncbi:hypothetical protein EVAR_39389_1 [Eumeta japonica]|uniref:Uncharacterized protein n=1 Tax=Eumeta variegata TaxID=151549 RepID=A0A4C1Z810_EUMVA|nr:hypothetical protein EVAR_39389_1 [Eumeta japonica]
MRVRLFASSNSGPYLIRGRLARTQLRRSQYGRGAEGSGTITNVETLLQNTFTIYDSTQGSIPLPPARALLCDDEDVRRPRRRPYSNT